MPIPVPRRSRPLDTPPAPHRSAAPVPVPTPTLAEDLGDDDETLSELALPELEKFEEKVDDLPAISDAEDDPTHVDLSERPPEESEDMAKKGGHPELEYKPPDPVLRPRLKPNLPPIPRGKLDGYGMFAAMASGLALVTSPIFLDFFSESPLAHFSDPGVELHISVLPKSRLPTGVWISGFRVPLDEEANVHVPYDRPYKLQVQREGYAEFAQGILFQPPKEKKEPDDRALSVTLVPAPFGTMNVGSSQPCAVEISDGVTSWTLKTPIREFKVPPADYVVKFVDPDCGDKQFYMPIRDGSRSDVVYEFPTSSKESGYLPVTETDLSKRAPASGAGNSQPPAR